MQNVPFCLFAPPQEGKKMVWEITSQCNMSCKHCCSDSSLKVYQDEFIFSNQKLINQRIDEMFLFGVRELYISGGEPLLMKNILVFLEYLKRKKIKVSIASNGYFLNEPLIKKLSRIKIDLLHISLDGHLPRLHNFLRGGDFFNKITKNVRKLMKYKIPTRIGCIIWRGNEMFLEEMVRLCIKLNVEELRFSWLIRIGRFKNNPRLYPKRKWLSIMKEIEYLNKKYKNKIRITIHRKPEVRAKKIPLTCPGGDKLFFINPKGEISPCSWIAKIDPNFTTEDFLGKTKFEKLVRAKETSEFRKMVKKRKNKNFKGCPFVAKYRNNSYYSDDNLINT